MRTINVEELEANLRDLLRAVREGEVLRVVYDGEVVAEVARPEPAEPPPPSPAPPAELEAQLQALEAAGQLRRATHPENRWRGFSSGLGLDPQVVDQILDEMRADRF